MWSTDGAYLPPGPFEFGAPVGALGVTAKDFIEPGNVIQIGLPSRRIDLLTRITGVGFDTAWNNRVERHVGGCRIPFLGRTELLRNKRATGRERDLADVALLEAATGRQESRPGTRD